MSSWQEVWSFNTAREPGGGWAVEDVALLIKLTGNSHDPHYRYAWLPAEAFAEGEGQAQ